MFAMDINTHTTIYTVLQPNQADSDLPAEKADEAKAVSPSQDMSNVRISSAAVTSDFLLSSSPLVEDAYREPKRVTVQQVGQTRLDENSSDSNQSAETEGHEVNELLAFKLNSYGTLGFSDDKNYSGGVSKQSNQNYQFGLAGMSDVGSILNTMVNGDSKQFSQTARNFSYSSMSASQVEPDFNNIEFGDIKDVLSFSFNLVTQDGDTIELNFNYQEAANKGVSFEGFSLDYNFEGELSEEELEQLEAFSSRLNQFTQNYFQRGKAALSALPMFELSEFAQVDLKLEDNRPTTHGNNRTLSISYGENELGRTLEVSNQYYEKDEDTGKLVRVNDHVKLSLDKLDLTGVDNAGKKQQALNHYLQLLEEGSREGNASDEMKSLMTESFRSMHKAPAADNIENDEADKNKSEKGVSDEVVADINVTGESKAGVITVLPRDIRPELTERDHSLLTGLGDFTFEANTRKTLVEDGVLGAVLGNPEKQNERFKFNLNMSQATQFQEDKKGNLREIVQSQKFELNAAYHKPVNDPYALIADFENQSYRFYEVHEKEEVTTTQRFNEAGDLVFASIFRDGESESRMREYRLGKLVDDDHEQNSYSSLKDVTDTLLTVEETQELDLLSEVLIEPFNDENKQQKKEEKEELNNPYIRIKP